MKRTNLFKKALAGTLALSVALSMAVASGAENAAKGQSAVPGSAANYFDLPGDRGVITQIMVPDGRGGMQTFFGEEARAYYDKIIADAANASTDMVTHKSASGFSPSAAEVKPFGMFSYKYRYVESRRDTFYGDARRITPYLRNTTSTVNSYSTEVSVSESWSINAGVSGEFLKAVKGELGASFTKECSFKQSISVNVGVKKEAWAEFQPRYQRSMGAAQKYYIPRGPINNKPCVEESKSVTIQSPTYVSQSFGGKTFQAPDGIYIWKERSY